MKRVFKWFGLMGLLLSLAACPDANKPPAQTPPKIASFTATPSNLTGAGAVTLTWIVENASSLTLNPNVGAVTGVTATVNVTATSSFELVAQNAAGTDKKTLLVTVNANPSTLTAADAWSALIPSNAKIIEPDVFKQHLASGELSLLSDARSNAQDSARETQFQADLSTLRSVANPSDSLRALLSAAANPSKDPEVTLANGEKVRLLGERDAARDLVYNLEKANTPSNALGLYSSLYDLAAAEIRAQLPTPVSLEGLALPALETALNDLNTLLSTEAGLDGTQLERPTQASTVMRPQAVIAGNGYDNDFYRRDCRTPIGLFARFRFPLKYFISPVKNQAARGLCWAFTAIGAIESRERVQSGSAVDLSEQFLAHKTKAQWSPSDYEDGFSADLVLDQASARLQTLPSESFWTYNPAFGRPTAAGDKLEQVVASYAKSCDWQVPNRPDLKYSGTCSDTAHQGNAVCTTIPIGGINYPFCATQTEQYSGAGTLSSSSRAVWTSGQPFLLPVYRALLAQGHTLMASFPVYQGFNSIDASGFLTNRARGTIDGNHVVQIVGFISNDQLTAPTDPQNAPGGGYFLIKNSWGCTFGDGGYAYIDAQYVQDVFFGLSVLNFDSSRSSAWTTEQTALVAPQIVPTVAPRQVDLRVSSNLGALFTVGHPQAEVKQVNLTVKLGNTTLYNGLAAAQGLLPLSIPYTFPSAGVQSLQVTARYGTQSTTQTIDFTVVNSAPIGDVRVAVTPIYVYSSAAGAAAFNLRITDPNESDPSALCDRVRWEVFAPDVIEGDANLGCAKQIRFGVSGYRDVYVYVTDSDGLTQRSGGAFYVAPPPANPNPVFEGAGVTPVERLSAGQCSIGRVLSNGVTLTLDSLAFGTNCAGNPNTARYNAIARASNPSAEQLRYDWTLRIGDSVAASSTTYDASTSSSSGFELGFVTFGLGGTLPCQLDVAITPSADSTRGKYATVWTGNCKVAPVVPR